MVDIRFKKKLPVYNPDKDGNPFDWIIRMSGLVRKQGQAETEALQESEQRRKALPMK